MRIETIVATIANAGAGNWGRATLLACVVACCGVVAQAQKYTPPPPPLTTDPCKPTKKAPCLKPEAQPAPAAEKFPFPGEDDAAPAAPARQGDSPESTKPVDGTKPGKAPPAGQAAPAAPGAFPFPEGDGPDMPGAAPAAGAPVAPAAGAPAAGESSSSSSSSSGSGSPGLPTSGDSGAEPARATAAGRGRRVLPKVEDKDRREAEDLEVSRYYTSTGNYLGAYNRALDAVATFPDDPEAHYLLAQTAQKMMHTDEAVAEYAKTIQLEPDGEHTQAARKALAALVKR